MKAVKTNNECITFRAIHYLRCRCSGASKSWANGVTVDWRDGCVGARASGLLSGFLDSKKLLGTEGFIVNLCSGFNQILQVSSGKEVAKVHEFAVVFVFDCTMQSISHLMNRTDYEFVLKCYH